MRPRAVPAARVPPQAPTAPEGRTSRGEGLYRLDRGFPSAGFRDRQCVPGPFGGRRGAGGRPPLRHATPAAAVAHHGRSATTSERPESYRRPDSLPLNSGRTGARQPQQQGQHVGAAEQGGTADSRKARRGPTLWIINQPCGPYMVVQGLGRLPRGDGIFGNRAGNKLEGAGSVHDGGPKHRCLDDAGGGGERAQKVGEMAT